MSVALDPTKKRRGPKNFRDLVAVNHLLSLEILGQSQFHQRAKRVVVKLRIPLLFGGVAQSVGLGPAQEDGGS